MISKIPSIKKPLDRFGSSELKRHKSSIPLKPTESETFSASETKPATSASRLPSQKERIIPSVTESAFQVYLKEINKIPLLSAEEEKELDQW